MCWLQRDRWSYCKGHYLSNMNSNNYTFSLTALKPLGSVAWHKYCLCRSVNRLFPFLVDFLVLALLGLLLLSLLLLVSFVLVLIFKVGLTDKKIYFVLNCICTYNQQKWRWRHVDLSIAANALVGLFSFGDKRNIIERHQEDAAQFIRDHRRSKTKMSVRFPKPHHLK